MQSFLHGMRKITKKNRRSNLGENFRIIPFFDAPIDVVRSEENVIIPELVYIKNSPQSFVITLITKCYKCTSNWI
jgi:hypothetical protein